MPGVGPRRVACVGAIAHDTCGRLLLVRRRWAPSAGSWSLPGGRVERHEDDVTALVREVLEETGMVVDVGPMVGVVERDGLSGSVYVIADYACSVVGGALRAGDDADDVTWASLDDLDALPLVPDLRETLARWDALPRR